MKTIKLTAEHRGTNSTTFTGRPQGKSVRGSLNLDQEDKDQEEVNIETQLYTLMYQTKYLILYYQLQGKIKPTYLRNRSVLK